MRERLDRAGLAIEYLPAFEQKHHDFHTHEFIEMLFVIRGNFRHIIADRTYDEKAGGLTILNYDQYHSLRTDEGPAELINVYWNPAVYSAPVLPDRFMSKLWDLVPLHPELGHRLNSVRHLITPDPDKVSALLKMLYYEQQSEHQAFEAAIQSLFRLFLIELCRAAPLKREEGETQQAVLMERVRQYLEKNFREPIRLEELSRICGLNEANLCRRFKEHTGLSTGDYLKQRRLSAALQKLRMSDDKILTVCHESGFTDISRFNRYFRQAMGCTPSEYRKNLIKRL